MGKEVERRLEIWQRSLHEIGERYLHLSRNCSSGALAVGKQRVKKRQKKTNSEFYQLSDYAAEVVYQFFLRVCALYKLTDGGNDNHLMIIISRLFYSLSCDLGLQ